MPPPHFFRRCTGAFSRSSPLGVPARTPSDSDRFDCIPFAGAKRSVTQPAFFYCRFRALPSARARPGRTARSLVVGRGGDELPIPGIASLAGGRLGEGGLGAEEDSGWAGCAELCVIAVLVELWGVAILRQKMAAGMPLWVGSRFRARRASGQDSTEIGR